MNHFALFVKHVNIHINQADIYTSNGRNLQSIKHIHPRLRFYKWTYSLTILFSIYILVYGILLSADLENDVLPKSVVIPIDMLSDLGTIDG